MTENVSKIEYSQMSKEDKSRLKMLYVPNSVLADLIAHCGENQLLQQFKDMPKDAILVASSPHYRFSSNEYSFKIWSSTFTPVQESHNVPEMKAELLPFQCFNCGCDPIRGMEVNDVCKMEFPTGGIAEEVETKPSSICANCGENHVDTGCNNFKPVEFDAYSLKVKDVCDMIETIKSAESTNGFDPDKQEKHAKEMLAEHGSSLTETEKDLYVRLCRMDGRTIYENYALEVLADKMASGSKSPRGGWF